MGGRSRDRRLRRGSTVELGEAREKEIRSQASPPHTDASQHPLPGDRDHPAMCLGESCSTSHRAPPAKALVLQVTHLDSLWGHPPHESSSLGLDPWRAPEKSDGQGRKTRMGWTPPQTPPLQLKTCPGITSTLRRHPAPYPSTAQLPAAGCDPPQGVQSQPKLRSRASPLQPEPGTPGEVRLIYQLKLRRGFPTRLSDSRHQPVDLTLLGHHNPSGQQPHLKSTPQVRGPPPRLHQWRGDPGAIQLPKAKPEPGDEGRSVQGENRARISKGSKQRAMGTAAEGCDEPGPSITSWRRGRGYGQRLWSPFLGQSSGVG